MALEMIKVFYILIKGDVDHDGRYDIYVLSMPLFLRSGNYLAERTHARARITAVFFYISNKEYSVFIRGFQKFLEVP